MFEPLEPTPRKVEKQKFAILRVTKERKNGTKKIAGYAVFKFGTRVQLSGILNDPGLCQDWIDRYHSDKRGQERTCINWECSRTFWSDHCGVRMCDTCRRRS